MKIPKFLQKASVQSGIISALAILVAVWLPSYLDAPKLRDENKTLQNELAKKSADLQLLETKFTPFKTLALEHFTGDENEALAKLALKMQEINDGVETLAKFQSAAHLFPDGQYVIENTAL